MKRKKRKVLSIITTAMLVLPLGLTPQMSATAATKGVSVSANDKLPSPAQKIAKKLETQFKDQEKVTFLIKMKEQVDTASVAKEAEKNATLSKATPAKTKSIKRSSIVSELKATAQETQFELMEFLEKQEAAGNAKEVHSYYVVNAIAVTTTKEVMEKIATFQEVEKILPNETRQLFVPQKANTAVLDAKAETNAIEWNIDRVGAPAVWDMGIDGSGITVASIDTGVQWNHPALQEKYRGYDAFDGEVTHENNWFDAVRGQSAPYDDQGHGTHVTGTMVGSEPDGNNAIGVAPGAKWIAVKAFTADGGTDVDLLEAGEWILAPNGNPDLAPDVVNNSWGGGAGLDEWYRPMVQAWRSAEIFPEFSAGNTTLTNPGGPGSVANPANYPESFATGATDINDQLGSFSLLGPSPYEEIKPEVTAPGVNIRSSVPGSSYEGGWNGTSMAGPHVAAAVALLLQANSSLTVEELEGILQMTAIPLTDSTYPTSPNNGYGSGLINVYDAVSSVVSGLGKLKGQVTKEGVDSEAPVLEHSQPATVFAGMPLTLEASAVDNISVTNVEVEYQFEDGSTKTIVANRVGGNYQNGTYQANIPGEDIAGDSFVYKWKVTDFGGNDVDSEYTVTVLPGITLGYSQDFENNPDGWTSYGDLNTWEWGVPSTGPGAAFSGEKVYGTTLDGTYQSRANMSLQLPPVDLPEGSSYLQFKQWHNLERNYDFGHVYVSTDNVNWVQKLRVNDTSEGWIDGEVDLSEYAGQRIYIAFNVTTDGSVVKDGWYIDDVFLTDTPLATTLKATLGVEADGKDSATIGMKEKVDPNKLTISLPETLKDAGTEKQVTPMLLPMNAQVSVLESGRSVKTNPANGSFELTHAAGEFTVVAESYGYYPETQTVTIEQDGEVEADFTLEELPQGNVSGTITNQVTGEPVAGATIYLIEDAKIAPAVTDENGQYSLTAYEGEYTLKVIAPHFYSQEVTITLEGSIDQDFEIKPFIGFPSEIGYDDGTAENARAFYDAGNGWAVKMSLAPGNTKALVTGGLFRFWDTEWPVPGGTAIKVEVYDATGVDGAPGKKLAGPIDATALRDGTWTHVDLSGEGIVVEGDFYLVYIQANINTASPGLGTDEDGENALRSWQYLSGSWSPAPEEEGNYMIRAVVDYEVTTPTITSPVDGAYTNDGTVTVEGSAAPTTTVHIYNGGEEVTTVAANENGTYAVEVELEDGENVLTSRASTEQGITDASAPVTVIYDQYAPELAITTPAEGSKSNKETVTVTGTVVEDHLNFVKVNGTVASVQNGNFSARILLDEGTNTIEVLAEDLAGNVSGNSVQINVDYTAPVIKDVKPAEDVTLKIGKTVKIEFTSEPGSTTSFAIRMPLTDLSRAQVQNSTELPLMEVSPGYYVGYYTATKDMVADGAVIEVKAKDSFGNETRQIADGKLFINVKNKGKKNK